MYIEGYLLKEQKRKQFCPKRHDTYIVGRKSGYGGGGCYACSKEDIKRYMKTSRGKLVYKNSNLKRLYGITLKDYSDLCIKQNHCCAICNRASNQNIKLVVDHCHKTGKVRGLLCYKCNIFLSAIENRDWYEKANVYLTGGINARLMENRKG